VAKAATATTGDHGTEHASNRAEFAAYRKRLFESRPEPEPAPLPTPVPLAYQKLMKRARRLAKAEGISEATAFERLYTDPRFAELAKAATRPASATAGPKKGTKGTDLLPIEEDDDEPDEADLDTDDGPMGDIDDLPDTDAATPNSGRARAPLGYRDGDNIAQDPKPAPIGTLSTDADRRKRPASALKRLPAADVERFRAKVAKRCDRYIKKNPGASRKEAMQYAMASKSARRAYKSWRKAS